MNNCVYGIVSDFGRIDTRFDRIAKAKEAANKFIKENISLTEKEYKRLRYHYDNVLEIYRIPLTITGREDYDRATLCEIVEITKRKMGGYNNESH